MKSTLRSDSGRFMVSALLKKHNVAEHVPTVQDDQPLNPYNEIQVLTGHQDIINILKIINDVRLASSADDNLVIIWDVENGDQVHCLQGHTRPVTSMLVHQQSGVMDQYYALVLITGSSDKTIRIWHCDNGICLNIIQDHCSTIKCLVNIHQDSMFCSGGEDLCLWDVQGQLLFKETQPNPDSDVHSIIPIKEDKLVVASSKQSLVIYKVSKDSEKRTLKFHSQLKPHREDIRCITNVTDESFASASLDGEIILWCSNSLQPIKQFNRVEEFEGFDHLYPYSVQHMFILVQRFIFAAVGAGFFVYDSVSGKCVAARKSAHHSKVSYLELLKERCILATCSEDGTVRLWGSSKRRLPVEFSPIEHFLGKSFRDIMSSVTEPELLGECLGHSGSVRMIANFGDEGFASCATDGLIILWKDGLRQRQKRIELATSLLFASS